MDCDYAPTAGGASGAELPTVAQPLGNGTRYLFQVTSQSKLQWDISVSGDSFEMTLSAEGSGDPTAEKRRNGLSV